MQRPLPTPSMFAILEALDAAPDKTMTRTAARLAAKLTMRGTRVVLARMEDDRFIASNHAGIVITWGGMEALKHHRFMKAAKVLS